MIPGPCAKVRVQCYLFTKDGGTFVGENWCRNPQDKCPRLPGEDYTKCKEICKQDAHAEVNAINKAKEHGADLKGAKAAILGHTYVCQHCKAALKSEGIIVETVNNYRDMSSFEVVT